MQKKYGEKKEYLQMCSFKPRDLMPTYPFQESERRSSAPRFSFVFVFFSWAELTLALLHKGQPRMQWSGDNNALRKGEKREILSVSRKSLKQGKLELIFGWCFLEFGNLRLNGTLKQGRSKHSNIPLSKRCLSFHSLFKNFHFFISV